MTAITVPQSGLRRFLTRSVWEPFLIIRRNTRALIGLLILLFFFLMATVGPEVVPLSMEAKYAERYAPISLQHPLGTDYVGRDVWAMLVHGSREVLFVAFLAAIFTTTIAIVIGTLAGLQGGMTDTILMLVTNAVLTVPSFPVMLMLGAFFRLNDPFSLALVLSAWQWGGLARASRSQILSMRQREFIEAAQVLGLSTPHVIFRELLPNIMPYVAISFLSFMRAAITASVGLMFLGLVPLNASNWGMMLNMAVRQSGAIYVPYALPYVLAPMGAIVLFQLGAVFFAHGLDEVLDPRLRAL
jgi:peptide/nickel transport system permease protein